MFPSPRWRQLIDERTQEAVTVLGEIPGVHGFVVGGSVGRGEPWPMSDIDLLPVYDDPAAAAETAAGQAAMVDWWAGSGRAQTLDLAWIAFTVNEIQDVMAAGPEALAARITGDLRWFHGIDKAYGGRAGRPDDELTTAFVEWITEVRFHPAVMTARVAEWRRQALAAAELADDPDPSAATNHLRESARALRMQVLESWGERLGSMGREWTRFERLAARHDRSDLAERIAVLAGADVPTAARRAESAPLWLRERIELCRTARAAVGEQVTDGENARDQHAAYALHVARKRPDLDGPWTGTPEPHLDTYRAELLRVIELTAGGV
ncbi:nucleotidyltransferase domain-containing protein [Actinoplanes sp. Pm04-4]|uniref:Nucleotidyltransferase domain-containing protein n=1 Tax=Paractinoplanes pyxinae TaxID=2997416 RepID=A0ABT4B6P7_9ACTN|nr:nucleotidyltransferase domain-containing protein [Actinoplanes pyxinae]MCY1142190.1 nucleotidyltransferase domain-containing protein [Actinoplanes pyxinae]